MVSNYKKKSILQYLKQWIATVHGIIQWTVVATIVEVIVVVANSRNTAVVGLGMEEGRKLLNE